MSCYRLPLLYLYELVAEVYRRVRQIFKRLTDYLDALVAFERTHDDSCEHVAALDHGHVKIEVLIGGVGRVLADVYLHARRSRVGADGAHAQRILARQHADALCAHGDGLIRQRDLGYPVKRSLELVAGGKQLAAQLVADIASRAADGDHGVIYAVAGHLLQQIHNKLTLIPDMHEHAVMPDDVAGDTEPQEVRMQALKLGGDDADVLTALRHLYAVYALDAHRVGKGVRVGTDAADAFDQHEGLYRVALGCELFYAAVVIADKHIRVADDLALGIELRVYRLLQRGMVRAYGNYIAHYCSSFRFLSTSSFSGMTSI